MGLEDISTYPRYNLPGEKQAATYLWSNGNVPFLLEHEPPRIPQLMRNQPVLYVFDHHSLGHLDAPDSTALIASIDDVADAHYTQELSDQLDAITASTSRVKLTPPEGARVHYWHLSDNELSYVRSSKFTQGKRPYFAQLANIFQTDATLEPEEPDFESGWPEYS